VGETLIFGLIWYTRKGEVTPVVMISMPVLTTTSVHCPPPIDPIKTVPTWLRQSTVEMITGRGPVEMIAGGTASRFVGHVEAVYGVVERVKEVPIALVSTVLPVSRKPISASLLSYMLVELLLLVLKWLLNQKVLLWVKVIPS
jgi:hypothetical protein